MRSRLGLRLAMRRRIVAARHVSPDLPIGERVGAKCAQFDEHPLKARRNEAEQAAPGCTCSNHMNRSWRDREEILLFQFAVLVADEEGERTLQDVERFAPLLTHLGDSSWASRSFEFDQSEAAAELIAGCEHFGVRLSYRVAPPRSCNRDNPRFSHSRPPIAEALALRPGES